MVTTLEELQPIEILPGVCPVTDATAANTRHWITADKIRFVKGKPQKIGGWDAITLNKQSLTGCVRTVFSSQVNDRVQTILGSNTALYALIGSDLQNISPFTVTPTAIADSLDTHYDTLATDPITVIDGNTSIQIADADALKFKVEDDYVLAGASAVGGVPTGDINKTHIIRAVSAGVVTVRVSTPPTSNATGGGASVVRSSGLITVNATAHGLANGYRVVLDNAADTGGILAAEIDVERIIRNVTTDTFDIMSAGVATSSVTGGGGASLEFYPQIAEGLCDETSGQGYGMNKYGNGLLGTAILSVNGRRFPRIWFADTFGDNIILTPGNGNGLYTWAGTQAAAPPLLTNAPTAVNYAFVSDNILVTFGAGNVQNKIKTSDIGDPTVWTASSVNQVFEDDIEGAGRLKSHVSLNGTNLIFTDNQCYTYRYIGAPLIWQTKFKDNIGIIAPMARVVVKGVAYFMGQDNFYLWRGGNIEVIPSNSSQESTLLKYVFENINRAQASKSFAWYNKRYDEIWFHYPSAESNEVNRIVRYHVTDLHWTPDAMDRTAAEYPVLNLQLPRLVDSLGNFYRHEVGHDDSAVAMAFSLTSPLQRFSSANVQNVIVVPDSIQTAGTNITLTVSGKSYPQSPIVKQSKNFTVTPQTEYIPTGVDGRYIQYAISGNALGQEWIMGEWLEGLQLSSRGS